jgi:hypothetical protein
MPTDDLWGDLPVPDKLVKPGRILQEQASLLSLKTNNVVEGEVRTFSPGGGNIGHDLYVKCAILDNYQVHVLRMSHNLLLIYPLSVINAMTAKNYSVSSEEELRKVLKDVFGSPDLRRIIAALLRETSETSETPRTS